MRGFRSALAAVISTGVLVFAAFVSFLCDDVTLHAVRTIGSAHYQVTCSRGRLIVIRNAQWWRVEPFYWVLDQPYDDDSPIKWPGYFEKTYRHALGFEFADGDYLTAFTCVGNATEFIPPFKPVKACTMLRTTRQFELWIFPPWFVVLSATLLPASRVGLPIRR